MREYTNKLLDLIDEGIYGDMTPYAQSLIRDLLCFMSEDDVKAFWYANGYADIFETEENEND